VSELAEWRQRHTGQSAKAEHADPERNEPERREDRHGHARST
jgi:hypothetical protein